MVVILITGILCAIALPVMQARIDKVNYSMDMNVKNIYAKLLVEFDPNSEVREHVHVIELFADFTDKPLRKTTKDDIPGFLGYRKEVLRGYGRSDDRIEEILGFEKGVLEKLVIITEN